MKSAFLPGLLSEVWSDLSNPSVAWQIAAIIFSIVVGMSLAHLLHRYFASKESMPKSLRFNTASFARLLAALFALGLIVFAKFLMTNWHGVSLLRVTIPFFFALVIIRFAFYMLEPIIARTSTTKHVLQALRRTLSVLVLGWFVMYITGVWPDVVHALDDTAIKIGTKNISIMTILQALASVVVTILLALWGSALVEDRLMRLEDVHTSFRVVLSRLARVLLVLVAVLLSLSMVGIDLTVLSVFGGALGVGLGFGLQKIASNYVSGLIILLVRSVTINDLITVDKY